MAGVAIHRASLDRTHLKLPSLLIARSVDIMIRLNPIESQAIRHKGVLS
jgi:hypothetical protein